MRMIFGGRVFCGLFLVLAGTPLTFPIDAPRSTLDWKPAEEIKLPELRGYSTIRAAFTPDGRSLVVARHKTVRIFHLETGGQTDEFDLIPGAYHGVILSIAIHPNGKVLALAGTGHRGIILWDLANKKQKGRLPGHGHSVLNVHFSPNGKILISYGSELSRFQKVFVSSDYGIRLWNTEAEEELQAFAGGLQAKSAAAISPDGKYLALGDYTGNITIMDVGSGKKVRTFPAREEQPMALPFLSPIGALTFSRSGGDLAATCGGAVAVFDPATGALRNRTVMHNYYLGFHLWFNAKDEAMISSGRANGDIVSANVKSGMELGALKGYENETDQVVISPDGKWLLSCSHHSRIKLWRLVTSN